MTVVGPNGAGKSTLIKTIFGLLQPRAGTVALPRRGHRRRASPTTITRRGMSYVPQLDNVFPSLTVEENLEMGSLDRSRTERADRATCTSSSRGSASGARQAAGTMCGGERQMVAMARALMPDPQVLLLDEPSAGLAPAFVDAIFEKIADINRAGVTIVMVEQNARRALAMSDRGYVLDLGTDRFEGPGERAARRPEGRRALPRRHGAHRQAERAERCRTQTAGARRPRPLCELRSAAGLTAAAARSTGTSSIDVELAALVLVDVVDAGGRVAVARPGRSAPDAPS